MGVVLTVRDETAAGSVFREIPLAFPSEHITIRDLIRERVYQEVQDFNRAQGERAFRGLVQPTDTERVLNNSVPEYRLKQPRTIDWNEQFEKAIEAFGDVGFLILVDNKQAGALDEEFTITPSTAVSFIKLTMLVGG